MKDLNCSCVNCATLAVSKESIEQFRLEWDLKPMKNVCITGHGTNEVWTLSDKVSYQLL